MKKILSNLFSLFLITLIVLLILTGCDNGFTQYPLDNFNTLLSPATGDISITDDGSTSLSDISLSSSSAIYTDSGITGFGGRP